MKKVLVFMVLLLAVPVFAGDLYTVGNTTGYSVVPARGGQPVITAIEYTAGAATVDGLVLVGDNTTALSEEGKAATATTFVLDSCTGIDNNDVVVIQQRPVGTPFEAAVVSSCNDTTELITLSAGTTNAFNGTYGFRFFEMKTLTTLSNVGTSLVYRSGDLWAGVRDKPLAFWLNGTGGTVHYMSAEWR